MLLGGRAGQGEGGPRGRGLRAGRGGRAGPRLRCRCSGSHGCDTGRAGEGPLGRCALVQQQVGECVKVLGQSGQRKGLAVCTR